MPSVRRSLALAVCLLAAAPASGSAAVRYASATSVDVASSCLSTATACTLKRAVDAAATGDEIVVGSGHYAVTAVLDLPGGAYLHGIAGGPRPQIASTLTTSAMTTTVGGLTHIANLELSAPSKGGVLYLNGDGAKVEGVVLNATGGGTALLEYDVSGVTTVRDTILTAAGTGSSAAFFGGQPAHMRNVTAYATGADSIGVKSYASRDLIGPNQCFGQGIGDVDVIASAVHGDGTDLVSQHAGNCGSNPRLAVSWSAYTSVAALGGASVDTSGGHNIAPLPAAIFTAPGTDFHAPASAPTVDAGTTDAFSGASDVDALPRLRGAAVDIGASEFFVPDGVLTPVTAGPTFNGAVNPHGMTTTAAFEYGPTTAYGSSTAPVAVGSDDATHGVSAAPAGTDPAAALHVRLRVTSGNANYTRTATSADGVYAPPAVTPAVVTPPVVTPPVVKPPVVTPPKAKPRCVVPKLARLTRAGARTRLLKAHCALGKVTGRTGGRVSTQSRKAGTKLPAGTKVAVRLKRATVAPRKRT